MSLTELSYYLRKSLPFFLIGLLIILIIFYFFRVLFSYLESQKQKVLYVNPIFGKIQKPIFDNATSSAQFSFTLDTIEGKPVTATESAKIFFFPAPTAKFGYREKLYLIAKTLGFDAESMRYQLNGREATFDNGKQILTVDVSNFNFSYEYRFASDDAEFRYTSNPTKSISETKASDFLKSIGRYPEEFAQGKTNTIFVYYTPSIKQMRIVEKSQEANASEVDFYTPDIDGISVISSRYPNSQNYVVMSFHNNDIKILKAQVKFYDRSQEQFGVYPLKSAEKAYEELRSGKGFVTHFSVETNNIAIKKMFLAYLDTPSYQTYLQPVYVFLGDNDFVGYTPALQDDYFIE